ncbi:MAG: SMR family transporter [Dehalococcoidia bacterium]
MAWIVVVVAGLMETAWALLLKRSEGLTRPLESVAFIVTLALSMALLGRALRTLPVGTAYAVWTGIGAAGTAVLGIVLLGESRDPLKLVSLALLVAGIAGLGLGGGH